LKIASSWPNSISSFSNGFMWKLSKRVGISRLWLLFVLGVSCCIVLRFCVIDHFIEPATACIFFVFVWVVFVWVRILRSLWVRFVLMSPAFHMIFEVLCLLLS
jgi:hypothetical protein